MAEAERGAALEAARRDMKALRGAEWAYEALEPARCALVGVDVTRYGLGQIPRLRAAIPRIDWLAKAMRAAGGLVIWNQLDSEALDERSGDILGKRHVSAIRKALTEHGAGEIADDVVVAPTDRRISRRGYTAFAPMLCHMPYILKDMGIDTVILVGAGAEASIDASARDAYAMGFRVVVASDACAAHEEGALDGCLATLHRRFADARPAEDIIAQLRRNAAPS